jgi:spore protease
MNNRTDLAVELIEQAGKDKTSGVENTTNNVEGVTITQTKITNEKGESIIGKPKGTYTTFEVTPFMDGNANFDGEVSVVANEIKKLIPDGEILVVGLGNKGITPDALGPLVADLTLVTRHIDKNMFEKIGLEELRPVSVMVPGVLGQTGIETANMVLSICKDTSPKSVIIVDALAASNIKRLGCTVQLSNTGINPGSGVANSRKELSFNTLGIPTISIGVPTVVDMKVEGNQSLMVTPREIDQVVKASAKLIAFAINKALHPTLSIEEITGLVS